MVNLRKFNNYDYSDVHINHIIAGMRAGTLTPAEDRKYELFDIAGDELIFLPLNLTCCRESEKEGIIESFYNNFSMSLGAGIKNLYNKICSQYLGINRKDVEEFLKKQTGYQLTKVITKKTTNKPMLAQYSNNMWSCDLIDVSNYEGHNRHRKYILTAIDHFSKYVFATAILNKEAQTIVDAFEVIVNQQAGNIYPEKIITDNGAEFKNVIFDRYCVLHNMSHLCTMSHSPKQNALIENANKYIRVAMSSLFVRTNSLKYIDNLQDIVNSRNNTVHNVTKKAPKDIWTNAINRVLNRKNLEVKAKLDAQVRSDITKTRSQELAVGDAVRVLLSAIETKVRKAIKEGDQKKVIVKYSPKIYFVTRVIQPTRTIRDFQQLRYTLADEAGNELWDDNNRGMKFYASDLQKVDRNSNHLLTVDDDKRLNKI